jgi:sugar phosphate isomerase/epimerase
MESDLVLGCRAHDLLDPARVGALGLPALDELASRIADKGFGSVQLALAKAVPGLDSSLGRLSPGLAYRVAEIFARHGVRIAVLGCYINPVHPDPDARRASLERFKEHLRFCRDFGCHIVATETGSRNADCSYHPGNADPGLFEELVASVSQLAEAAEKSGSIVCVEGVVRHTASTPEKLARLLGRVRSDNLQALFDPVNFLDAGNYRDQRKIIDEAFALYGDRILVVHAKDFLPAESGLAVVPPGKGLLDYPYLLGKLKRAKPYADILIEDLRPDSMEAARKFVSQGYARA